MQAFLKQVPQPEDLPPTNRKLRFEDIADEIERLAPFLGVHGYKATTFRDFLRINHYEVQYRLDWQRRDDAGRKQDDERPNLGEDEGTTLDQALALIRDHRSAYSLFDFGLLEKTLITCVHRPSCPDQIFSVWRMPRNSRQGRCWQLFSRLRREGRLPRGIIPFEDVLEYGENSLLVFVCRPPEFKLDNNRSINPVRALQKTLEAFEALSDLHKVGVSINYWPDLAPQTDNICYDYAYDRNHASSFTDSHGLGWAEADDDPSYAQITGRPFPRYVEYRIPASDLPSPRRHAGSDPRLLSAWDCHAADNEATPGPAHVSLGNPPFNVQDADCHVSVPLAICVGQLKRE